MCSVSPVDELHALGQTLVKNKYVYTKKLYKLENKAKAKNFERHTKNNFWLKTHFITNTQHRKKLAQIKPNCK